MQISGQFGSTELRHTLLHFAKVGAIAGVFAILEYAKNQNYGDFSVMIIPILTSIVTAYQQREIGISQ